MTASLRETLDKAWLAEKTLSFYTLSGLSQTLSFQEFGEGVGATASSLRSLGVGPGVVVAVLASTGLELCQAIAATWSLGATLTVLPTPTRFGSSQKYLAESLQKLVRSQAGIVIGDDACISVLRGQTSIAILSWADLDKHSKAEARPAPALLNLRPALIQFSSGTTRDPQPIVLTEQALLHNSRAVLDCFPGGAEQHSCVSWLPLYHDMGLIGCFLMPLLAPGNLTLMAPETFALRPKLWLQAISEQRATTSSAPNFALAHCVARVSDEDVKSLDLSCWQIALVGAETVRPKTLQDFAKKFAITGFHNRAFSPVYGLAEATLAVTFSPLGEGTTTFSYDAQAIAESGRVLPGTKESVCLGKPLAEVELEIRRDTEILDEGLLGQVWVKSPSLMSGTIEEGAFKPLAGDWLDTGDTGFMHRGHLYLYGRRRDILLLDGRNHDPSLLEEAAETLAGIKRACAFVQEVDGLERDQLVLLCEVERAWKGDLAELLDSILVVCRKQAQLVPEIVTLLKAGELPLTSSGKLRRRVAALSYQAADLAQVEELKV